MADLPNMTVEENLQYRLLQCQQMFAAIVEQYGTQTVQGKVLDIAFDSLEQHYMHARVEVVQDSIERRVRLTLGG